MDKHLATLIRKHFHPGGVMTRMGPEKGISKREGVDGMRQVIDNFSIRWKGNGLVKSFDEEPLDRIHHLGSDYNSLR